MTQPSPIPSDERIVDAMIELAHRQHLYRTYINDDGSVSNSYALHHYIAEPRRIQMDQQPSTLASVLAIAAVRAQASLVNFLRTQIAADVRTYRPEKYYMRGPGPKWREKNAPGHVSTRRSGQLLTSAAPASSTTTENCSPSVARYDIRLVTRPTTELGAYAS